MRDVRCLLGSQKWRRRQIEDAEDLACVGCGKGRDTVTSGRRPSSLVVAFAVAIAAVSAGCGPQADPDRGAVGPTNGENARVLVSQGLITHEKGEPTSHAEPARDAPSRHLMPLPTEYVGTWQSSTDHADIWLNVFTDSTFTCTLWGSAPRPWFVGKGSTKSTRGGLTFHFTTGDVWEAARKYGSYPSKRTDGRPLMILTVDVPPLGRVSFVKN